MTGTAALTADSLSAIDKALQRSSTATADRVIEWRQDLVSVLDAWRDSLLTGMSSIASDPVISVVRKLNDAICQSVVSFHPS